MITQEDIVEFKLISKEERGIELSDFQAVEELTALLNMVKSLVSSNRTSLISKDPVDLNIQKEQS